MNNYAHLKPDSPFAGIFEGDMVPIISCLVPGRAICGESTTAEAVYEVDLSKLTPKQFERVARICHSRYPQVPFEECKAEIRQRGLPLRASQTDSVSTMFWL